MGCKDCNQIKACGIEHTIVGKLDEFGNASCAGRALFQLSTLVGGLPNSTQLKVWLCAHSENVKSLKFIDKQGKRILVSSEWKRY